MVEGEAAMADHDKNDDDFTASLHDIFAAVDDALAAMRDGLSEAVDQIWNHPINWEWLLYAVGAVVLAIAGFVVLAVLYSILLLLYEVLAALVESAWLLIQRRRGRGGQREPAKVPPSPKREGQ